jgi:YVTN family beta-propeller protein
LQNDYYSFGVPMSVRRVGWLAAIVFLVVFWSACGQVYRPVVIPCSSGTIPNCPVETNPQPANFHSVLGVSTNIPNYAGSAMQIDVAGDSIVGETSTSTGNSPNTGFNPTHGVILPNDSEVFVATAGSVYDKGIDAIDFFTPVFQSTLATGLGVVSTISLPPLTSQSSSITALSEAGNVVTATLSAPLLASPGSAALVPVGSALVISGEDIPGYNGTFLISSVSTTSVSFVDSLAGLASCSALTTPCAVAATAYIPPQPVFLASIENAEMYVANFNSNSVAKISTNSNVVTNTATTQPPCVVPCTTIPASNPVSMAEANARQGEKLYIANQANNTVTSLNSIDLSSNNATNNVTGFTGVTPVWVVARADGQKVYVVTQGDGQLVTIDTATDSVSSSLPVGAGANYVFLDPNFNRLYVVNPSTATLYLFSDTGGVDGTGVPNDTPVLLSTISFATGSVACPSGCTPVSVTALLDGSRFYVASYQSYAANCPDSNVSNACIVPQLTVFNATSFAVQYPSAPTMTLLTWPPFSTNQYAVPPVAGCALSPSYTPTSTRFRLFTVASADSTRVYVSMCDAGAVAVINTTGANINNPNQPEPPDALVTTLLTPYSGGAPQANGEPLPQSPIFLFVGQ